MRDTRRPDPGRLMSRRGLGAQAALLATSSLVACGGGEERGSGPPSGGSGQGGALGGLDLDDPRVQEAMEACSERGPGLRLAE
jgi:hypothetical protein